MTAQTKILLFGMAGTAGIALGAFWGFLTTALIVAAAHWAYFPSEK